MVRFNKKRIDEWLLEQEQKQRQKVHTARKRKNKKDVAANETLFVQTTETEKPTAEVVND